MTILVYKTDGQIIKIDDDEITITRQWGIIEGRTGYDTSAFKDNTDTIVKIEVIP